MKLKKLEIKNFRIFDDITIEFEDYSCIIGPNGVGKSTILHALNLFFRQSADVATDLQTLGEEDFHNRNIECPIYITLTFGDLSEDAQEEFKGYFRQGSLIVTAKAEFEKSTEKAVVQQLGLRSGIKSFANFFAEHDRNATAGKLKEIYNEIRQTFSDLPAAGSKEKNYQSLREYEEANPNSCELMESSHSFYGFTKGKDRLEKYIQWVYVPAIKDPLSEQLEVRNSALGQLLARTVRAHVDFSDAVEGLKSGTLDQYRELLAKQQGVLGELSHSLGSKVAEWAHPDATMRLEWREDPDKSIRIDEPMARIIAGESGFEGELSRFGHGLQRSYIIALLQELADFDEENAPTLLLGFEEPELFQHPPQTRHIATVLQDLAGSGSQVIVSSHSPHFVTGRGFEDVRLVQRDGNQNRSAVRYSTFEDIGRQIAKVLGGQPQKATGTLAKLDHQLQPEINEMLFASRVVFVEGMEDIAYIKSYMHIMEKWDDYRRLGVHIVPVGGKTNFYQPIAIANCMGIPYQVMFDGDLGKGKNESEKNALKKHNARLLDLCGENTHELDPEKTFWGKRCVVWPTDIEESVTRDFGSEKWRDYRSQAQSKYGDIKGLKKNTLAIGASLLLAWQDEEVSESLLSLIDFLINPKH